MDVDTLDDSPPDRLSTAMADILADIRWKQWGLLVVLFILFSSSAFITNVFGHIPSAQKNGQLTNYGTVLQAMLLAMSMVIIDALIRTGVI